MVAWNSSLNTINVGKFELGCTSIGVATHSFYETLAHAAARNVYGRYVTDFPHVKKTVCGKLATPGSRP